MLVNFLKRSWLVIVAAFVFGLLVAVVNGALEERIANNAKEKLQKRMFELLDGADSFEIVAGDDGVVLYYIGKDASGGIVGYALKASDSGFADKIVLLVAFGSELKALRGFAVLKSNETPGFGDKIKTVGDGVKITFRDQFVNCPIDQKLMITKTGDKKKVDAEIVAVSGATVSSEAAGKIVNDAIGRMRELIQE